MADAGTVAAREARRRGADGLPPCTGMGTPAAVDLAAGGAAAGQPRPPRLPVRGDARLSHAGQCGSARCFAGSRMDEAGLAGGVPWCRIRDAARLAAAAPRCAARGAVAGGATGWRTCRTGARPGWLGLERTT